jgi:hypothetical protein
MKKAILSLLLLIFLHQFLKAQKVPFFRLYNSEGKKISKGHLFDTTDTSIILSKGTSGKKFIETPITEIDFIKTNRTTAKRIVNTTLSVIGVAAIIVIAIYSLAQNDGHRNRSVRNKNTSINKNGIQDGISKPLKPLKRYEISNNLQTWPEKRVLLHRLL